jgi:hypothetical protein
MIECEWQAWYDRLPGGDNRLHVAGMCEVEDDSVQLFLEGDDGARPEGPDLIVLELKSRPPDAGDESMIDKQVSWTGEPGTGIRRVRIGGEADVTLNVRDVA